MDVEKLLEYQKSVDEIIEDDLDEFRVKHGIIT